MGGRNRFTSTLHFGPLKEFDGFEKANVEFVKAEEGDLADKFHYYELIWNKDEIKTMIDGTVVLDFKFDKNLFEKGEFPKEIYNPWKHEKDLNAPFN